ncbi:hypothetical protein C4D60_Mb01t27230 [Musa balbisiana]|uniref:Uncharacterized protein n=1 Tax=Musa balbisiana TaxID=52838 RepID=A0A4S8JR33_MUSBA|nr:hypothetical protein C4D60_Mb01t27230 [Musa balbisiana]
MQRGGVPSPSQWDASHLFSFFRYYTLPISVPCPWTRTTKLNTLFLICFRNNTRRNHISYNGSACTMRFLNAVYHGLLVGLVPNTQKNGRLLLGVGRSISSERQEDGDEDDRDINVNTVQTDIVLSKEVLTIQRSLLNQIVEKRELASSTKDSVGTKEKDSFLFYGEMGEKNRKGRGKRETEQRGGQLREERRKGMGGKLLRVGGEDSSDDCCLLWTEEERGKREERRGE